MVKDRVLVVGAGIGGLCSAIWLARAGLSVTVCERATASGGKMREVETGGARVDSGPTVMTMRWVFDELFESAGSSLEAGLTLTPASVLARHAWSAGERLDLFADPERSQAAIGDFAGTQAARVYRSFRAESQRIYETLRDPFLRSGVSIRSGTRWAPIFRTRGCDSCLAALPPTAAPHPSPPRRR
jgi:1-hydroxycarotenoid 3,4-desaturase